MLSNFHTHSTFCDGSATPEEIVIRAICDGFEAIGFSGHGYTDFDLRYCIKDMPGYIREINRLKQKYDGKIEIYLGVEEDAFCLADKSALDYIIGSSHYFFLDGKYYPIDSDYNYFSRCLNAFGHDIIKLSQTYYSTFCNYIIKRKPDIVGHFDLITKFDEAHSSGFLESREYLKISEKYLVAAMRADVIFEVNTGAISRGYRTKPYPHENLLHILKKNGGKVILSSDSHNPETLSYGFDEAKSILRDVGFDCVYTIRNGQFVKSSL